MSFDQLKLHSIIVRNLLHMGYEVPRPIQAQAIGPILQGRDVIGLAKTGTGKTAAFIAPVMDRLISEKPPQRKGKPIDPATRLRAIVLCPTRELAQQVAREASAIAQGSVLRVACVYGKSAISPQAQAIARGVDLVVATPGRVRELIDAGALSLAHVRFAVVDEADRMLDMGFLPQVRQILQQIPEQRQTLLFTATMPAEVEELGIEFLREPVRIESEPHSQPVQHVQPHLLPVRDDDKVALLLHLLEKTNHRGVLVFCRTKRRVGWVGNALQRNQIATGMLHGDMSQAQRTKSLQRFTDRELRVLVATDVAARGLHIPAVNTVINYDLPLTPEEYVHRVGRAAHGREAARGEAYTLLSDHREERLRWRHVLDKLHLEVFAEELEGFVPTKPSRRKQTAGRSPSARAEVKSDKADGASSKRKKLRKTGRSRKSRPIKAGQKPGQGVRRLS